MQSRSHHLAHAFADTTLIMQLDGPGAGEKIRDEKVRVLEAMPPVTLDEVFLGQYEGYTDDETITNKDSNCHTFACVR